MGPAAVIQGAVGVVQAGIGVAQSISGNKRLKRLLKQREDYLTPGEVGDAFKIAQNNLQGQSAAGKAYFDKNNNNALTSSLDSVTRYGGNINDISAIFSKNVDAMMQNNASSELQRVQQFDKLYTTIQGVIQGKDAEAADRRAKQNDLEAAAAMQVKAGNENLKSGINGIMGAVANDKLGKLGKDATAGAAGTLNQMPPPTVGGPRLTARLTPSVSEISRDFTTPNNEELLEFWRKYGK